MPMNKQTGNMYSFVTHTWNPIKGCRHNCPYCYVPDLPNYSMEPRITPKEFKTDLGSGNFIFVGSTSDMFGDWISDDWIQKVLQYCRRFPSNKYLFQSKNPGRFMTWEILNSFPPYSVLGTTIETNREDDWGDAPSRTQRQIWMKALPVYPKMISIEPIMDFDMDKLVRWISQIKPVFVSIGADSKKHDLKEPDKLKIHCLVEELKHHTEVILKDNLKRIYNYEEFL